MDGWLSPGARAALGGVFGWTLAVVAALVSGFLAGYWIGHRGITPADQAFRAFLWIPLLWMGFPEMFLAYFVTWIAWYLPFHIESRWFRVGCAAAVFLVWLLVIWAKVEQSKAAKFGGGF
ncbi:MAG: hypothetical protein K2W96_06275 [Gemmataceae bacterium]|nr:hypothetical protein [Gemmataceae bacterium]